ncbi:DNA repair protein RAD50-like [Sitodiplosis mosellana]|uniref:DNA repair protein RAD50-like n=1 Tax=Sitodiplosis mosellana TaxID=263140 RepID=UPI002444F266|nr:DNA repair protein RAD50-like [Sitodiplosis mosellana]
MAMLDKLRIRGIRNFGIREEDEQEITFSTPVTCIVGGNGAGKTTILESIKFALIAKMPPYCARGVGFITDPDILDLNETIGKVELTIKDTSGREIVISRKHKVCKDRKTGSSVESTVSQFENGNQTPLERRVLGATGDVCDIMKVSKAIIDHVLFCHQEDASWPIDGDSVVKKIFEDVFETDRYNKSLEKMRKLYKTKKEKEIPTIQDNLKDMKRFKDEADKKQAELTKNLGELCSLQNKCETYQTELKPLMEQYQNVEERLTQFSEIANEIKVTETSLRNEECTERKLRVKIKNVFQGTKEELELAIESLEKSQSQSQNMLPNLEVELTNNQHKYEQIKSQIQEKDQTYQQMSQSHDLNTFLCNEIERYKSVFHTDFNIVLNEDFNAQDDRIQIVQIELQNSVEETTNQNDQVDADYEQQLQSEYEALAVTKCEVKLQTDHLVNLNQELVNQCNELQSLNESEQHLVEVQTKIEQNITAVAELNASCNLLDAEFLTKHEQRQHLTADMEEVCETLFSTTDTSLSADKEESAKKRDDLKSLDSLNKRRKALSEQIGALNIEQKNEIYRTNMRSIFELQKKEIELRRREFQLESKVKRYNVLKFRTEELREQINVIENEKKAKGQSLGVIESNIEHIKEEQLKAKNNGTEKRDEAIKRLMELKMIIECITRVLEKKTSLENLFSEINQHRIELDRLRTDKSTQNNVMRLNENKIKQLEKSITIQKEQRLDFENNVELKDVQRKMKETRLKLQSLRAEGATDFGQIDAKKQEFAQQINKREKLKNQTNGQIMEKNNTIENLKIELADPKYSDSERNCKIAEYEVLVQEKAVNDLSTYCTKMQQAICQFHKKAMEKINRSIKEYWRSVYKGNDIDSIEIKTDEVKENSGRRSFTYRVIASKNDKQMDFRGQCSAGQRVLASLIIRLALADTFAAHCGVFALDEPTTNLDKANIESLCEALNQIIEDRRAQNNFMLIIITHNVEFMRAMNVGANFWRVERHPETKKSVIKDNDEIDDVNKEAGTA